MRGVVVRVSANGYRLAARANTPRHVMMINTTDSRLGPIRGTHSLNVLLVYLDQDEVVLVTLQPEFASRDLNGTLRRLAYVDRRLQIFPHLKPSDLPSDARLLDVQPARSDCRYFNVDDETLRHLRELEMSRAAQSALEGRTADEAVKEMNSAVAAIPSFVVAERDRLRRSGGDPASFATWSSRGSLALLEDSHADLAARIVAAAATLRRYSLDPIAVEGPDLMAEVAHPDAIAPSGLWRKHYDRPRAG
jgi:hypothetical protein